MRKKGGINNLAIPPSTWSIEAAEPVLSIPVDEVDEGLIPKVGLVVVPVVPVPVLPVVGDVPGVPLVGVVVGVPAVLQQQQEQASKLIQIAISKEK